MACPYHLRQHSLLRQPTYVKALTASFTSLNHSGFQFALSLWPLEWAFKRTFNFFFFFKGQSILSCVFFVSWRGFILFSSQYCQKWNIVSAFIFSSLQSIIFTAKQLFQDADLFLLHFCFQEFPLVSECSPSSVWHTRSCVT